MTPFLRQVAEHYFRQTERNFCYVFPNRRSMLFFDKYYSRLVKDKGQAMFKPEMLTINEFFYKVCRQNETDRIDLLLCLYECYAECRKKVDPKALVEPLDDFIFWGEMILSDFNDVDKYCVDAKSIFTNVAEFKAMQDFSIFNEAQQKALKAFMHNFSLSSDEKKYKQEFRKIWDILYPLYERFNEALREKGKAYEGMVYKQLVEKCRNNSVTDILAHAFEDVNCFVFIGLNAPSESEITVLRKMHNAQIAEFCWDYSSEWIKNKYNRSSFFLDRNIATFGQAFAIDPDGLKTPEINVLSVPSSVGQCKQLNHIFKRLGTDININTAVVLPDENLLIPTLNSLPENIEKVNVTMGYPMSGSLINALVEDLCAMQMHLRQKDGQWLFYYKQLDSIFANPLFKEALLPKERQNVEKQQGEFKHYKSREVLCDGQDGLTDALFRPAVTDPASTDPQQINALCDYLQNAIAKLATRLLEGHNTSFELDFAEDYYKALESLKQYNLAILPATFFRLLSSMVGRSSVPFKGEPLEGLQIMGPLETRCLDFDNVVILSCNEGTFPRRNVGDSFIPPEIRKGFGLPTYEYQDSLWAYYFYRLIQRASKVWLLVDTGTGNGLKSTEESRYIKQLALHFKADINRYVAKATIRLNSKNISKPKSAEQIAKLKNETLSASSIKEYLKCPLSFYFAKVEGLKEPQETKESLDAANIGTVLHKVMQTLYTLPDCKMTKSYLRQLKDDRSYEQLVEDEILTVLGSIELSGKNLFYKHQICSYVEQILKTDIDYLENSKASEFSILGLELGMEKIIHGFRFYGVADRIDSFEKGVLRIVDYKTGKVNEDDIKITEAAPVVEKLFDEGTPQQKKATIALQLYIYDILSDELFPDYTQKSQVIYQTANIFKGEANVADYPSDFKEEMHKKLCECLDELADTSKDWEQTSIEENCTYCNFKTICGK